MQVDRTRPVRVDTNGAGHASLCARVVILHGGSQARVQVLELPDTTGVGQAFRYDGKTWRVIGLRPSSKVFIAEPE